MAVTEKIEPFAQAANQHIIVKEVEESGRERLITTSPVPLHGIATIVADGLLCVYFTTESSDMRLGTARIS